MPKKEKEDSRNLVQTIQKNDAIQVRVSIDCFKGHDFVSIREFYYDDKTSEWKPSNKGFTLPIDTIDETAGDLIEGLQRVVSILSGEDD
jgi:transcriptional regulator